MLSWWSQILLGARDFAFLRFCRAWAAWWQLGMLAQNADFLSFSFF
jgi:hypothetical protein